jgi:hypothetical protein
MSETAIVPSPRVPTGGQWPRQVGRRGPVRGATAESTQDAHMAGDSNRRSTAAPPLHSTAPPRRHPVGSSL